MAGHAYTCPVCGFSSVGHETKKQRDFRGKQHEEEHESGQIMPEIAEFMKGDGK